MSIEEITVFHTPEEGREITNANVRQLFGRVEDGPRNRIFMPTESVSLPNAWTNLGLNFSVEANVMYRFHASILFDAGAEVVGFAVNGPASPHNLYYGVRQSHFDDGDSTRRANKYEDNDVLIDSEGLPGAWMYNAELWGIVKPSAAGTLQVVGRRGVIGSAVVYKPSCLEWW